MGLNTRKLLAMGFHGLLLIAVNNVTSVLTLIDGMISLFLSAMVKILG